MTQFRDIPAGGKFRLYDNPTCVVYVKYAADSECKGYGSYRFPDDFASMPPYLCADWTEVYAAE